MESISMESKEGKTAYEKYGMPVALFLGLALIAAALYYGDASPRPAENTGTNGAAPSVNIADVNTENSPSIGSLTAPVTIAVWYDFRCPHCKNFELNTLEPLVDDYVASGKLRIVYKDFQFLSQDSLETAILSRAVWEAHPNLWSSWFSAVMEKEGTEGFGTILSVQELTRTIPGIDATVVLSLAESKRATYEAAINADREEGGSFGINGTPGTIVGTEVFAGAVSLAELTSAIEQEL